MDRASDDFEKVLIQYSEIETFPEEQTTVPLPKTIQRYHQKVNSNNSTSIFDADYTLHENPTDRLASKDLATFEEEKVTYMISGRGRGGRNVMVTPQVARTNAQFDCDDDIRRQIRKVSGLGYSNELIEATIKAQQMAKLSERDSGNSSSSSAKTTANPTPNSPANSSGKSTPSTRTSDIDSTSSDHFTPQEQNTSLSLVKSEETLQLIEAEDEAMDVSEEHKVPTTDDTLTTSPSLDENKGAVKKTPLPLSQILKQSRARHRRKVTDQKPILNNLNLNQEVKCVGLNKDELATQRTIAEILRQDRLEEDRRKRLVSEESSSASSKEEVLSWRRRTNSPPRFAWGAGMRPLNRGLDIDSNEDFPILK